MIFHNGWLNPISHCMSWLWHMEKHRTPGQTMPLWIVVGLHSSRKLWYVSLGFGRKPKLKKQRNFEVPWSQMVVSWWWWWWQGRLCCSNLVLCCCSYCWCCCWPCACLCSSLSIICGLCCCCDCCCCCQPMIFHHRDFVCVGDGLYTPIHPSISILRMVYHRSYCITKYSSSCDNITVLYALLPVFETVVSWLVGSNISICTWDDDWGPITSIWGVITKRLWLWFSTASMYVSRLYVYIIYNIIYIIYNIYIMLIYIYIYTYISHDIPLVS